MSGLRFIPFMARDGAWLASARGDVPGTADWQAHQDGGRGWTAIDGIGRPWWCGGFAERVPGKVGVAWAVFAPGIGIARHMTVTRFTRAMVAASPLVRIEALVPDDGRCAKWAEACGLVFETRLRRFFGDADAIAYAQVRP